MRSYINKNTKTINDMKKRVFTVLLSLLVMGVGYGQTILSEGFENLSMPPSGWTEWAECDECEPESWYGWTLDNHSHSGNRSAFVDFAYPGHSSYLITPHLHISNGTILSFWYADQYPGSIASTTLTVEISTTYNDPYSFTPLQTISLPTTAYQFELALVDLSAYAGQNVYIAFHVEDQYGTGVYIDDVTVGATPSCLPPTDVSALSLSTDEVVIYWSHSSDSVLYYTVQYDVSQNGWSNAVTANTTDTFLLISNLDVELLYDARVMAVCDSTYSSDWSDVITFETACAPITLTADSNMWMEDFDGVVATGRLPLNNCWSTPIMSNYYGTPALYCGSSAAAYSGVNSLEMKGDYWEENMVVLPAFTNNLKDLRLSFRANTNATSVNDAGIVEIGYVTDPNDPTTFTLLEQLAIKTESLNRTSTPPYGPYYYLTAPDTGRIAIRFTSTTYSISWNFDNITIGLNPDCLEPVSLQASNISSNSADLSWLTYGEHNYDIMIWQSGTTDTTYYYGISYTELPFTVDSLQPLTTYSWLARTICEDSTYSTSPLRGHFTTPDVSIELPYLQDFEGDPADITEFVFSGSGISQWYIGAATGVVDPDNPWATHSMYISDDQGLSNHYGGSQDSYAYAVFQVQFPPTHMEYHLEFDYKLVGEGGWDYFAVYLMDGGAEVPSSGAPTGVQLLPNAYNTGGWQHANLVLPNAVGTNKQIVFYWVNDGYWFYNPPVAVDNITISGDLCAKPSALSLQNLQATSAALQWQENSSATSWKLYYKRVGVSDTMSTLVINGTPSVTLTNLIANTDYLCYVTAFCDDGVESHPSNPLTFRTACGGQGIEVLPYIESFSTTVSLGSSAFDEYVPCWTRLQSNADHRVYVNTQDFGDNCLDFHYTPGCYTMAVLPPLSQEIPANTVRLTFDARRHNLNSGALEVGVMTNPSDASTFQVVDTVVLSDTYVWETHSVYCNGYTGNGQYLAFRVYNAGNYTVAIDNLKVDYLPDCLPVTNVQVSDIATTGATVTWDGNGDSYYVYVAGPTHNIYTTNTSSITLNDLLASTNYSVIVQTICGEESAPLSSSVHFQTACGPITVTADHPWGETFELYNVPEYQVTPLSACWGIPVVTNTSWGVYPGVVGGAEGAHSGNNTVEMYGSANMLVLPEFSNPLNTLRISFWASTGNTFAENTGTVQLGYLSNPNNPLSFTSIATVPPMALGYVGTDSPHADLFGPLDLQDVTAPAGSRLAIRYVNSIYAYNSWHFDDFNVSLIPNCPSPVKSSVTITNITSTEADVSWVDHDTTHTVWEVHYKPEEEGEWYSVMSTETTLSLIDLAPNTTYEVYVITLCDSSIGVPDETFTVQFTTTMLAEELPYTTNFTNTDGWRFNNGNFANYWTIGSPSPGSHALYVTYNGITAGYDETAESYITVEKLFTVGTDPEFHISFDVNVGGDYYQSYSTDFDFMKLFFAPATENYEDWSPYSPPTWSAPDYSNYACDFTNYLFQSYGGPTPYKFSLTGGNTIHVDAIMTNPNPNPNEHSLAKLVFAWVNDNTDGTQPGPIITNLSVSAVTCQQPSNLTVSNIGTASANISWDGPSQTTWIFQYKHYYSSSWITVPVASHYCQLNGLSPNTLYYVRIAADCGDGETSVWSETSFKTHICEASERCPYTLYLTDSYGDGWNGASLNVLQEGVLLGTFTVATGYNTQATISLCDSTSTTFSWSGGSYDNECTIYLYGPDGTQVYTHSDMTDLSGPFYTFVTDCSSAGSDCEVPIGILASEITDTTAYVDWMIVGNEQSYVLAYTTDTTGVWTYDTLPFNFDNLVGLTPGTTYYVRVMSNCGGTNVSGWSEVVTFTTTGGEVPLIEPIVITQIAMDITGYSATLNGAIVEPGNQPILDRGFELRKVSDTAYTVIVLQSIDPILEATVTNLTPLTSYTYRAFVTTDYGTYYGQDRYFVTLEGIDTCDTPTNLDTVAVYNASLTIAWTDNADANQWNVRYREPGGSWDTISVAATTFYLTGLSEHTTYEIQVQADCGEDNLSEWSNTLTVTTKGVGIPSWLENSVMLFPNPAKEVVNVQCTMNNVQWDGAFVEVYDVYGKLLQTVRISSETTTLNVAGLANGMYFVRVNTEAGMVTKTFVKK